MYWKITENNWAPHRLSVAGYKKMLLPDVLKAYLSINIGRAH